MRDMDGRRASEAAVARIDLRSRMLLVVLTLAVASMFGMPQEALAAEASPGVPILYSLSDSIAPPRSHVTVYGANFGDTKGPRDDVYCCGKKARTISWSDTEIVFEVPTGLQTPGYVGVQNDGIGSNGLYLVPFLQPRIDTVSSMQELPGTLITITGANFENAQRDGWVSFAGTPGTVVSWSDTRIQVEVPPGAHAGYLGVVQHDMNSNGRFFIPFENPAVSSISTTFARVGDSVSISGTSFGDGADEVVVGGVPVAATAWTDTQVSFSVPDNVTSGYAGIRRDGITSNGKYIIIGPRLDGLSSTWAAPGSTVTLNGAGFGDGSDGRVLLNGSAVPTESWSNTAIIARIPVGSSTGNLQVVRGEWGTSITKYIVVNKPATITGVSTNRVMPGMLVTITGQDFGAADPKSSVRFDGLEIDDILSWSDTEIQIRVPDGVTSGYLGVYKEGLSSNGIWMQYGAPIPVVSGISAWWGVPGDQVTITGQDFGEVQGSGYPVFSGVPAQVVSWSDTSVIAIVPEGSTTGYAGIVQNGITSNGKFFMPYPPPHITTVSTSQAAVGQLVTVTGSGFRDAPGRLTVAGVEVSPASWSATRIEFTVPAGLASGYVGVTHDGIVSNGVWLAILP